MNAYRMDAYTGNVRVRRNKSVGHVVLRVLRAFFEVLAERLSADTIRASAVGVSFLVALGVIGGMETGAVSVYVGLPVCVAAAAVGLLTRIED